MGKAHKGFTAAQAAAARTAGKNTPADVLEAFFPEKITAAEFQIQPVNLATFMALEKIGSPLAVFGANQANISAQDIAKALVILTLPTSTDEDLNRIREIVSSPATVDEIAWRVGARIPASELIALGPKISERINKAFATALPTKSPGEAADGPFPDSQPAAQPSAGL